MYNPQITKIKEDFETGFSRKRKKIGENYEREKIRPKDGTLGNR